MRDSGALPASAPIPLRRNRDFQLLWSGQAVSVLGSEISAIAYPLLVLALTSSPALAGIVGFAGRLPNLLLPLPAGALVDRWDRRRLMIVCDVGRGGALASLALALLLGHLSMAQILAVAFVEGTLGVLFRLAQLGAVRRVVPAEQLPAALSQEEGRMRGAGLLGRPVGGLLFGLGQLLPFLADAASYVASVGTLLLIRSRFQEDRVAERRHMIAEIREGLVWLWNQPFLRMAAALVAASNLLFQALVLVLIVLARERGAPPSLIGLMLGGAGLGGLFGALCASWFQRRLPAKAVVIGANWVWAVLMPLVVFAPNLYALGGVLALMAFIGPAWNVVMGTYRLRLTPDALLGRVASAGSMLAAGALPLGSLMGGLLIQSIGPVGASVVLSSGMLLLAVAGTVSPSVRHARAVRFG